MKHADELTEVGAPLKKRVKINSCEYGGLEDWIAKIEKVLDQGSLPVIKHFRRDVHLEPVIELAFRHKLTVLLNPQETECQFRRNF
jgi:hypothetical protein